MLRHLLNAIDALFNPPVFKLSEPLDPVAAKQLKPTPAQLIVAASRAS